MAWMDRPSHRSLGITAFFFQLLEPRINANKRKKASVKPQKPACRLSPRKEVQENLLDSTDKERSLRWWAVQSCLWRPKTRKKKYPKNDGDLPGESNDFDDLFGEIWDAEWARNLLTMALEQGARRGVVQVVPDL
jgi:hypothetical protein